MTGSNQITLDVAYDENGVFDASSLILQLQRELGGRLVVTDWIDERAIEERYPHLPAEARIDVLSELNFNVGDYDAVVVDKEMRANCLDELVVQAGYDVTTYHEGSGNSAGL